MAVSPTGAIAAIRETPGHPQEIFTRSNCDDGWRQLGDVNGEIARRFPSYPELRRIEWTGKDGLKLESFVFVRYDLGAGPHPMVVDIHGGPCMSAKYCFDPCGGLAWAAAGYVVFVPNYRGNVGWGQVFTKMNVGDPAGAEFDDIMAGVDKCIELGLADPDRLRSPAPPMAAISAPGPSPPQTASRRRSLYPRYATRSARTFPATMISTSSSMVAR